MNKRTYTVSFDDKPERLDTYIAAKCDMTRSQIARQIKLGHIQVNNKVEKASFKVHSGDVIDIISPDEPDDILIPENVPLDIIWEDDSIVVVNKPPGMVVYPAAGNRSGTLMNALISQCRQLASIGAPLRPGVVHRLDKDTSGLIVLAKEDRAYYSLVEQFRERKIEKKYLALIYGMPKEKQGEINRVIGRSTSDRKKMSTKTKSGREAITHYNVMEVFGEASLVEVRILTGRTHQIRVHFASIGHAVLGDRTYGRKTSLRSGQRVIKFDRQMLHACSLKLHHPLSGESLEFTAPLPEDMEKAIEELKKI
jgi:23S rRNA pseudouridine1911/1915/1917 synthase